ncbi:hypothetical protein CFO_g1800 [Ceratocystis platani]|uniref:Rhodopsin domain-containing protein n=1 Tax=Ceratocystis fimbriata f. sp. platani TaxID=88771 RepID=A0A0F8BTC9_CERFI|nr:hypothetical protein CFO_g1800 [Ceratocystis platani]
MLSLSTVFVALRVYCKTLNARGLWWDDYILLLAYVIFVANVCMSEFNARIGMGTHIYYIDVTDLSRLALLGNISGFISIFASIFSKISFAVTLLRITKGIWRDYGIFSAALSGLIDLLLAMLPWKIIWGLQMRTKEKIGVGAAMSMGMFACVTACVKASKVPSLGSGDFTYHGAELVIWAAAEVGTSMMAASIPVLRVLITRMKTTYLNSGEKRSHPHSDRSNDSGGSKGGTLSGSGRRSRIFDPDEDILVTKTQSGTAMSDTTCPDIQRPSTSRTMTIGYNDGHDLQHLDEGLELGKIEHIV